MLTDRQRTALPVFGNICLIDVLFRGQLTAAAVRYRRVYYCVCECVFGSHGTTRAQCYDFQPWTEYFAVLDDGVLLTLWTARHKTGGWFALRQDSSIPLM